MNRHERRKREAFARYRYDTKHGGPKFPSQAMEEGKAKKRKRLLMTKQEKQKLNGGKN